MTRKRFLLSTAGLAVLLAGIDLGTKSLAESHLAGKEPVEVLGGLLVLVFARNEGAFLSLGSSFAPWARFAFLVALPAAALVGFAVWLVASSVPSRSLAAVAALFLAGGFGNLVERALSGSVRDFLNFGIGKLRTGVLNVADLYLTAALVAILIRDSALHRARKR